MRDRIPAERVIFEGVPYWRRVGNRYFQHELVYLHRAVWQSLHGAIPEGMLVHHLDNNPGNNDPSNLALMNRSTHMTLHHSGICTEANRKHLEDVRSLCTAAIRSVEGRRAIGEGSKRGWVNRPFAEHVCIICGQTYPSRSSDPNLKYCSHSCKNVARREGSVKCR